MLRKSWVMVRKRWVMVRKVHSHSEELLSHCRNSLVIVMKDWVMVKHWVMVRKYSVVSRTCYWHSPGHYGKTTGWYTHHFHPHLWMVEFPYFPGIQFSSVQSLSHVWLFATPWIAACQASLSITNSQSLLKPMSIELVMPSSHLILCRPLLLLPPIPPSIRVFSNESTLHMR